MGGGVPHDDDDERDSTRPSRLTTALGLKFEMFLLPDHMDDEGTANSLFDEVVVLRHEILRELKHPYTSMADAAYLCIADGKANRQNTKQWLILQRVGHFLSFTVRSVDK